MDSAPSCEQQDLENKATSFRETAGLLNEGMR